ncbi:OLC1v1003199C1 [Oldenlandia corymbosa var. corymbosa]|uniref:OLC1v1003199C1 n=1 Tax=Oldenlandia corymbosa var. corymbosa TaxID=529605 RepID=A0AAV1DA56_OLDCO|nr:OLC1v1003199C1 [Oldenlandia corymbosa var. corymbosa]
MNLEAERAMGLVEEAKGEAGIGFEDRILANDLPLPITAVAVLHANAIVSIIFGSSKAAQTRMSPSSMKSVSRHLVSQFHSSSSSGTTTLTKKSCIDLLKSCKSMNQLKQIQAQVFLLGHHRSLDVLHKLMAFTADPSLGNLDYAQRVFEHIEYPSLFVYNVMIKAYTRIGQFRKALFLFDELRGRGIWPDNYTYPFVFKSIGQLKMGREGEKIHGYVLKNGNAFDSYVCNSIMDLYGAIGYVDGLNKVFEEMPQRDLVSWNVLIAGYVRCGRFKDAIGVYKTMRQQRIVMPDEATVVSTLSACIALKNLELGKEIHDYVNNELDLTVIIGNALLDMYSKCGCLSLARQIFDSMPERNVMCWTSMVSAYLSVGQLDEARELFQRSPARDLVLWTAMINGQTKIFQGLEHKDAASWTAIICGLAMNGKSSKALEMFSEMKNAGIKPDDITFIGVLSACSHGGLVEEGRQHFDSMGKVFQLEPKLEHYSCLIDLLGRAGQLREARDIIELIPSKDNKIVIPLYGALLSACRIHGDVDLGECIANTLMRIAHNDSSTHALLANIYASVDRWEDAKKVRIKMRSDGVEKDQGKKHIDKRRDLQLPVDEPESCCDVQKSDKQML